MIKLYLSKILKIIDKLMKVNSMYFSPLILVMISLVNLQQATGNFLEASHNSTYMR
jgi:hypothetical protein